MGYNSVVVTRGLRNIADGREFIIEALREDGGNPLLYLPDYSEENLKSRYDAEHDAECEFIGAATERSNLLCELCGDLMERVLIVHTDSWMYTAFVCPNHPNRLLLDIFAKMDSGTQWCWINSCYANTDTTSNPPITALTGVIIHNHTGPGERYQLFKSRLEGKPLYVLTPRGIKSLNPIKTSHRKFFGLFGRR